MRKTLAILAFICYTLNPPLASANTITYAQKLCAEQPSVYECLTVAQFAQERGASAHSWSTLLPEKADRVFVQQLNRSTVFSSKTALALPRDRIFDLTAHTPFNMFEPSITAETIVYDPTLLAWALYDSSGELVRWGTGIGGASWCKDVQRGCRTLVGTFELLQKHGAEHRSSKYPLGCGNKKAKRPRPCARTPYMMTFHPLGYGFHASSDIPGYHASHGCVRLRFDDAEWLHAQVVVGTRVIIRPY